MAFRPTDPIPDNVVRALEKNPGDNTWGLLEFLCEAQGKLGVSLSVETVASLANDYRAHCNDRNNSVTVMSPAGAKTIVELDPLQVTHLDLLVEELELSQRSRWCFANCKIFRLGQLIQLTDTQLLKVKNFGRLSLKETKEFLREQFGFETGTVLPPHLAEKFSLPDSFLPK